MALLVQENRTGLFNKCVCVGGDGTKGREKMEVGGHYFMKNKEEKWSFIVIST